MLALELRRRYQSIVNKLRDSIELSNLRSAVVRRLGLGSSLSDLPVPARVYLLGIWAASSALIIWAMREFTWSPEPLGTALLMVGLNCGLGLFAIQLRPGEVQASLEVSGSIATIMLLPPPLIPLVMLISKGLIQMRFERPWYKKAFNVGQWIIVDTTLAWVFRYLGGYGPFMVNSIGNVAALATVWVGHYALNTSLVIVAVSFASGVSPVTIWRTDLRDVVYHQIFTAPLGTLLALLIQHHFLAVILLIPPLIIMYRAIQLTTALRRRTVDALMAFANSVDARDPTTYQHSERVAELTRAIAEQMGLPRDEVETLYLSARVHDLGKVGIPDAILLKPGELSNAEYDTIKEHPIISAQIVKSFPLFDVGRDIIQHHHERYDGEGYPDRLSGSDIPLGARIIAVADTYDAMASDRPYRSGLSHEVAMQIMIEERGKQFDPDVVDAFCEVMKTAPSEIALTDMARNGRGAVVHTPASERAVAATPCSS